MTAVTVTPEDVTLAVRQTDEALNAVRGFLPANVGIPLLQARGKLTVALVAVEAWEARLRLEAIEESKT